MILIISEETDVSTSNVINWICRMGGVFFRVNQSDFVEYFVRKKDGQLHITVKNKTIALSDITCFWHRRGDIYYKKFEYSNEPILEKREHLYSEWFAVKQYLFHKLRKKPHIANKDPNLNKLIVLEEAQKIGLLIPPFVVCDKPVHIFSKNITKAINNSYTINHLDTIETFYTEDFGGFESESFYISLIQQKIKPLYEVRTVFVKNKCWSMAIHNYDVSTDYRKNNGEKLRHSPYKLPSDIEIKFIKLCKKLNLDFGVADFIVDKDGKHFLLEINPSGQYGTVSLYCNYPIDKEIAKILVSYEKRKMCTPVNI